MHKCSIPTQGQTIYCYLSNIIIYPPTCGFSLLYLFGFYSLFLCRGQRCEYWVGSLFFLFTSFHAVARERSGAICLIGSFCLQCCDRAERYLQPYCTGRTLPHTFPLMRTENLKWKSAPALVLQEMRLL